MSLKLKPILSWISQLRSSIFLKISLSFIISCVIVIALVQAIMLKIVGPNSTQLRTQDTNRAQYSLYLLDHLGAPPDLVKAEKMAKDLEMDIRITGPGVDYQSPSFNLPSFQKLEKQSRRCPIRPVSITKYKQQIVSLIERNSFQYVFSFKSDAFSEGRIDLIPLLIGMILLVFFGCYFWIQRLFIPLKSLMEGVKRVSEGELDFKIQVNTQDELSSLARSFNEMVFKIRSMLQSREQLLYDVSHELRSPLTRIRMALELGGSECKTRVERNVKTLESMIEVLLDSARLTSQNPFPLKMESIQIQVLLNEILTKFELDRPRILLKDLAQDLSILGDRNQVSIALGNIIENALKYSSHQSHPVEISADRDIENQVCIHVRDFGCGIPEEEQKLIFEPFYRVDKSRNGATTGYGLGLSLCKKIMDLHSGKILVESQSGQGTQVTLVFSNACR